MASRDWTMTFDDDPPLKTLEAAQLAGVKRLLKDNGYDIRCHRRQAGQADRRGAGRLPQEDAFPRAGRERRIIRSPGK